MSEENKYKFWSLSPTVMKKEKLENDKDDVYVKAQKVYNQALDHAFNDDSVSNIAISGFYGSGKSSVWETYVEDRGIKNVITLSVGKYEEEAEGDLEIEENSHEDDEAETTDSPSEDSKKVNVNRIEKMLINQIMGQVDSKAIPLAKNKFKENKSKMGVFLQVIAAMAFVFGLIFLIPGSFLAESLLKHLDKGAMLGFTLFFVLATLIPLTFFFKKTFSESLITGAKFKFKDAKAQVNSEESDESAIDNDIKELIYILKNAKSEAIVIEDLDRYNEISIFTKLREMNFLLNHYSKKLGNKKTIKFIYMVKDGLFNSKNRTKFFDFILPIVPVLDSSNSKTKIQEFLGDLKYKPSEDTIFKVSLYVDEMRLLKNIVNEYIIYQEILIMDKLKLSSDKLFAIIVLKNVHPEEFQDLQENKGYIHDIFEAAEAKKEKLISKLKEEGGDNKGLEKEISDIEASSLKTLINDYKCEIKDSKDKKVRRLGLIKMLIKEGLIDETYPLYKGFFHPGELKFNDRIYLKNLYEGNDENLKLELETPVNVFRRFKDGDYRKNNMLNKTLVEYCLENEEEEKMDRMFESVKFNNTYDDLHEIIKNFNEDKIKTFTNMFIKFSEEELSKFLSHIPEEKLYNQIIRSIKEYDKDNEITRDDLKKSYTKRK